MTAFANDPAQADDLWGPPKTSGGAGYIPEPDDGDKGGSYLDGLLGTDPTKSFKESWLDMLYGEDAPTSTKEGDGTGTTLGKAALSAAVSPLAMMAVAGGELMDMFAYGPWGVGEHHATEEAKEKIKEKEDKKKGDLIAPPTDMIPA